MIHMAMNLGPKGAPKVRSGTIYSMRKMHCPPRKERDLVEPKTRKKEKKMLCSVSCVYTYEYRVVNAVRKATGKYKRIRITLRIGCVGQKAAYNESMVESDRPYEDSRMYVWSLDHKS